MLPARHRLGAAALAIGAALVGLRVRPRPPALTGLLVTALVWTVARYTSSSVHHRPAADRRVAARLSQETP
jgi:hypothetical protein